MLTQKFFEISQVDLDNLCNRATLGVVMSVRCMKLRAAGVRPVFLPEFNIHQLMSNGERISRNIKDGGQKGRDWASPYLKPFLAINTDDLKKMDVDYKQLMTNAGLNWEEPECGWFYTQDTGLVASPTIGYDSGRWSFQMEPGVELSLEENPDWNMGVFGSEYLNTSNYWTWPWCLGWVSRENRIVSWYEHTAGLLMGRRVEGRLGKFLSSFGFNSMATEKIMDQLSSMDSSAVKLGVAITADDIAKVYRGGPGSCMSYEKFRGKMGQFKDGEQYNPVRAYAYPLDRTEIVPESGNTLGVAYLGNLDIGKVKARAVVDVERKMYTRIYGVPYFESILESAGYRRADVDISKQKLSLITLPNGEVCFPYLDFNACHGAIKDDYILLLNGYQWENISFLKKTFGNTISRVSRSAAGYQIPDVIFFCAECGATESTRGEVARIRYPEGDMICARCSGNKYVGALLGFSETGSSITRFARQSDVTYVHPHYIINESLPQMACNCERCGQLTLNVRAQTSSDGKHLCRRCWSNDDIANRFTAMIYWDQDQNQIGVSSFRKTDGFMAVGFELPVHIISMPVLCESEPCPRCNSFLRKGFNCTCQQEEAAEVEEDEEDGEDLRW